jgi:hypothetical protein
MAQKVNLEVKGVIENMSWFTGDDGTRYEIFGAGGGEELAERLDVPLLGRIPLVPALREGGDAGPAGRGGRPRRRGGRAFAAIAERIDAPPCGSPTARAARWGPLREASPTSRSAAPTRSAASASAAERRPGHARSIPRPDRPLLDRGCCSSPARAGGQDHHRRRAGAARRRAGQAHPRVRGRRQGQPRRLLRGGPPASSPARCSPACGHVDGHRGVAQGVPEPPAEGPAVAASARWPAPSTSWPTPRRGEGDPHRRQARLGGARAHYDLVVVDAAATGHIVGQLAAPQAINELVQVGLVRDQTRWMLDILGRPGPDRRW